MPGTRQLEPFLSPLTQEAVDASAECYPNEYIIETLIMLSRYLINHTGSSILFGKPQKHDPFSPSLRTMYERLDNGKVGPSQLPSELLTTEHKKARIHERSEIPIYLRPLADFEDLYYAVVSSLKETYQWMNDHVRSGFHDLSSPVGPEGETIADIHQGLLEHWNVLNHPACGRALDDAVQYSRSEAIQSEIYRLVEANDLLPDEAQQQLNTLYKLHLDKDLEGMLFINAWPPAVISITLQQKYSSMLGLEKEEHEKRALRKKKQNKSNTLKKVKFSFDHSDSKSRDQIDQQQQQQHTNPAHPTTTSTIPHNHTASQENTFPGFGKELTPQDKIRFAKEWAMKKQRVAEYKNRLRASASAEARSLVRINTLSLEARMRHMSM